MQDGGGAASGLKPAPRRYHHYMSSVESKGGLARKLLALTMGAVAAKLALIAVEQIWTRGFRQSLPEFTDEESVLRKVAWIGLTAAAVGVARELARELTAPKVREQA